MTLLAQDANDHGVIVFQGKPTWAWAMRPSTIVRPAVIPDATKLYTIYSNLGSKTDTYDDKQATVVSGPSYGSGQQWIAQPFIPKSNAEVTEIEVAVSYYSGTNGVTISLNTDKSSLPGKPLHTWNLTNLPTFGTCCKLDMIKDAKGLKVIKSKQYWIVARTNKSTESTGDAWDFTWNDSIGKKAFNDGSGWQLNSGNLGALGVFGTKTE